MKPRLTKTRIALLSIFVLLAVGYAVGTAYINSAAFRHRLLEQVNAAVDGTLTIEGHYLALHDARLELSNVRLTDARGEPLASIHQLRMVLHWPSLFRRTFHIKALSVEKTRFHLGYNPDDQLRRLNTVTPSGPPEKESEGSKKWTWRIDDFRLEDGALGFERPAKGWSGTIETFNISAGIDSKHPSGHVQIISGPLQWQHSDAAYALPSLNLSADLKERQTITIKAETPKSEVKVWGRLDGAPTRPLLDMVCDLNMDPGEFHSWLPLLTGLKGRIKAHITAKGDPKDPTVTVNAGLTDAHLMRIPIAQLETELRMHQRKVAVNTMSSSDWGNINLTGNVDLQSVFKDGMNKGGAQWDRLAYQMKIEGRQLQPDRLERLDFPLGGTFELQGSITGKGVAGPEAKGKARLDIQVSGLSARPGAPKTDGRLTADVQRKGATIGLDRLHAMVGAHTLKAAGRINISTHRIEQAKADIQSPRLGELGTLFGIRLPSGTGKVAVTCQGPFKQPTGHIDLLGQALSLEGHHLGRLLAQARMDDQGVLDIPKMVLENKGSLVEGSGRLTLLQKGGGLRANPGVDLKLIFQQLAPSDFGLTELDGSHFNGRISLGGPIQHLTGQAVLEESVIRWGGLDCRVRANGRWDDGRLTIADLNLFKERSSVHLKGSATWRRPGDDEWLAAPVVQAQIHGRKIRLQDFFQGHSGILGVDGRVSGPSSDINGIFELSGTDLKIGGQPFKSLNIKGRGTTEKVYWDTMEIAVEKGQLFTSQGWYAFDRRFSMTAAAEDIGLAHVAALQQAYPIDGRLSLNLKAAGSVDDPQMDAGLIIRTPRLNGQPWNDFHMMAHTRNRRIKLSADLNFNFTADYALDSGDFDLQADFNQSDLSPYLALWAGSDWAGKLTGQLQAKGNRGHPDQVHGTLSINNTELRYQNQAILSVPQLKASLENGRLEMPSSRLVLLDDGFVDLSAVGRLPGDLSIESGGRIPLVALAPFVDTLAQAKGDLSFQTLVQGPLDGLQWQSKLDLNDTGFEIPGLAQQVEGLNGHLEINPGSLVVQDLTGQMDGGRFKLNGKMQLKQWHPVGGQLTLNAQALPLQWPDTMDVVVNGDLALKGSAGAPALSGQLVLLEGTYYKNVKLNLLSAVTQTKRAVPVPSTYSVPGKLGKTSLNVGVTHRYPLLVDNNLANLQIAPDLKISGTLARPILSGRAQVSEGEVIFRRKSFEVKRGVVDFINPYKIEPNLDIVAEADIRQWRVSLSLSGTPDQLAFKLASNPPESENDILSLILLGRTGSELAKGKDGGNQTTRQMLASLVATAWGEDVKKHAGVDILEVETGAGEDQESADRVQVTVGKRLSRRLTMKYEVESGSEELVQRAISEYRFLEHLLGSGFQDSKGGYGGELVFRIEF